MLGGSVISPSDKARLLEQGVSAVFGAGASGGEIVATVLRLAAASAD
jgi:methylmalonyl-CoA mutase cobalamin-binding subunit